MLGTKMRAMFQRTRGRDLFESVSLVLYRLTSFSTFVFQLLIIATEKASSNSDGFRDKFERFLSAKK